MSKSVKRVEGALRSAGLSVNIREVIGETRTALQAAEAVGCSVAQIAKSIIFRGEATGGVILFITSGGSHVDPTLASAVAGQPLGKADGDLIREKTGFAIGGVAPIGHLVEVPAFFDPTLLRFPVIWAAAGTPRHLFEIAPDVLLRISGARQASFTT